MKRTESNPCGGRFDRHEGETHAVLSFMRGELLYDIGNCAYIEGHIVPEEAEHVRHMLTDVCDEGNVDRITRTLDQRYTECVEMLYPYAKFPVLTSGQLRPWEDRLKETDVYEIHLDLPAGFAHMSVGRLEQLIHEYLVCRGVQEWLSIVHPEKSGVWEIKAEAAKEAIAATRNMRTGVIRRKGHPF